MRYELGKIWHTRWVVLLLAAVAVLNGLLFYFHCISGNGQYTQLDIREKYQNIQGLEEEYQKLLDWIWSDAPAADDALLTGDLYKELALDEAVLERVRQAGEYPEYLNGTLREIAAKIQSGRFGGPGSFAVRSMELSASAYEKLTDLAPVPMYHGGVEVLLDWNVTDLLLILFPFASGLLLMTMEQSNGMMLLLKPMKRGRRHLYVQKFCAMVLVAAAGFLLLHGGNVVIAGTVLGFGDLAEPVQGVWGLQDCPLWLSILGYLLEYYSCKLLWILAVSGILFLLAGCFDQAPVVFLGSCGVLLASVLLEKLPFLWLRTISLSWLAKPGNLLDGCGYLNLFGLPVRQCAVGLLWCGTLLAATFGAGLILHCRKTAVPASKGRLGLRLPSLCRHTCLLRHELYKVFWIEGGALVLLLFLALQLGVYRSFYVDQSAMERTYQQYSLALEGSPSVEKEEYLRQEAERFDGIQSEIDEYAANLSTDSMAFQSLTNDLYTQLRLAEAFEKARNQYESLADSEQYVYQTGYQRLYNAEGLADDLGNCAKWFIVLTVSLSGLYATERMTGVNLLQNTAGAGANVSRRKTVCSGTILLLTFLVAFAPQYIVVIRGYGLPDVLVPAQSLEIFSGISSRWSILGVLALTNGIRLLLGMVACWIIAIFSRKANHTVEALFLSGAVLLIPLGVYLLMFMN